MPLIFTVARGDRVQIGQVELIVERTRGGELTISTSAGELRIARVERKVGMGWVSAQRKGGRWKMRVAAPPHVSVVRSPKGAERREEE